MYDPKVANATDEELIAMAAHDGAPPESLVAELAARLGEKLELEDEVDALEAAHSVAVQGYEIEISELEDEVDALRAELEEARE